MVNQNEIKMKKIIFIYLFIYLSSCKTTTGYYHGYVLDKKTNPISNVKVSEYHKIHLSTITDSTGYFRLYHSPNFVSNLIFYKEGYQTDTIQTRWNRYDGLGQRFLNKIPDTLIIQKVNISNR
ncbi:MAG: carboxypeptidase-like regulatory domain-containing protein [Flavobacteriaceae bacterium]|nr:carboxypeptidase-like regulatory domain-containing protein [Flavobacteriaceae bacterium]